MALLKQKVNGAWVTVPLVNKITVDSAISDTSENPVQNKVIKEQIDNLQNYASERIYIGADAPADTSKLWIDTDDEGGEILATVATSGDYNDLINKPTNITMDEVRAEIETAIAAIAIYDGSVS